ncbi:unnamed protein product [Urochloa humidicola]
MSWDDSEGLGCSWPIRRRVEGSRRRGRTGLLGSERCFRSDPCLDGEATVIKMLILCLGGRSHGGIIFFIPRVLPPLVSLCPASSYWLHVSPICLSASYNLSRRYSATRKLL